MKPTRHACVHAHGCLRLGLPKPSYYPGLQQDPVAQEHTRQRSKSIAIMPEPRRYLSSSKLDIHERSHRGDTHGPVCREVSKLPCATERSQIESRHLRRLQNRGDTTALCHLLSSIVGMDLLSHHPACALQQRHSLKQEEYRVRVGNSAMILEPRARQSGLGPHCSRTSKKPEQRQPDMLLLDGAGLAHRQRAAQTKRRSAPPSKGGVRP